MLFYLQEDSSYLKLNEEFANRETENMICDGGIAVEVVIVCNQTNGDLNESNSYIA